MSRCSLSMVSTRLPSRSKIERLGLSLDEFCRRVRGGLAHATWEQKRQLIEWLVARVIVSDGEVEIRYVIPSTPAAEADRFCHLRSDYREHLRQAEGVQGRRHPLRQDRHQLRRHHPSRGRHHRFTMTVNRPWLCGPGMRWCGLILKMDGSLVQASRTAWNGVRHLSALRCLAKL